MPPKKKKGKKKKKKEKLNLTHVDRAFYELTIADINRKLARLRLYVETLDERNRVVEEKLHELEFDRTDVASHLQRVLEQRNESIVQLERQLEEINKIRIEEARIAKEKIAMLEEKYWAMHDQLFSEIKLLSGKLKSLDEFRLLRQDLYLKLEELQEKSKEGENKHKAEIHAFEQRLIVEKDALKKEVELRLLELSEDFTRSSEIRSAGYTRRLIRENIALQKEIDKLIMTQLKLQQQYNNQKEKHKQILEQYLALDQIKIELVRNSVNKIKIIEGLTKNYERLKTKYVEMVRYQKAYEALHATDDCGKMRQKDALQKIHLLSKRIDVLTLEKRRNVLVHEQHEFEIVRLRGILEGIKNTIVDAIKTIKDIEIIKTLQNDTLSVDKETMNDLQESANQACEAWESKRVDLLKQLMEIIRSHNEDLPQTPSIETVEGDSTSLYEPGKMGFMKRADLSDGLNNVFQKSIMQVSESVTEVTKRVSEEEEQKVSTDPIIDVHWGSTFFVSSSYTAMTEIEEEPLEYDDGEYASSSVSVQKAPSAESTVQVPLAPPEQIKTSDQESKIQHKIFDDEEEEEQEEEEEYEIHPWLY